MLNNVAYFDVVNCMIFFTIDYGVGVGVELGHGQGHLILSPCCNVDYNQQNTLC